jgi:hypothetical protein
VYERLLGKLPWPEDMMQMFSLKLTQELPPLHHVLPEVPANLSLWLAELTASDVQQRFSSAAAARAALTRSVPVQ